MIRVASIRHLTVSKQVFISSTRCASSVSDRLPPPTVELTKNPGKLPTGGLAFGRNFSDHIYIAEYDSNRGWYDARIEPLRPFDLHPAAKALHYAVSIFEGMKAFRGDDDRIRLFRPRENVKRFNKSAQRVVLPQINEDDLLAAIKQLVSVDRNFVPKSTETEPTSLYIRPSLIGSEPSLEVKESKLAICYVMLSPVGAYFPTGLKPVKLFATAQYVRAAYGGTGENKMSGNYAPTIYVQKLADRYGCQQVLWLNNEIDETGTSQLQLTEVGTMNCFVFMRNKNNEKELVTAPLDGLVLPGVTRKSVLELTRSWNEFRVSERKFTMNELRETIQEGRMIEMFGTGTACVVCPIEKILFDKEELNVPCTMDKDSLTKRMFDSIVNIQYGRIPHEWSDIVE